MASKNAVLYAEKRYELEEIKHKLNEEFDKRKSRVEFTREILREAGDTKTLLLIYEKYFFRNQSYAGLVILLSEYHGCQSADAVATGGKEFIFSLGAEDDLVQIGREALQNIGFQSKT